MKEAIQKQRHINEIEARKTAIKLRGGHGAITDNGQATGPGQRTGIMFPPLTIKAANLHLMEPRKPSDLPLAEVQKVRFVRDNDVLQFFVFIFLCVLFNSLL